MKANWVVLNLEKIRNLTKQLEAAIEQKDEKKCEDLIDEIHREGKGRPG